MKDVGATTITLKDEKEHELVSTGSYTKNTVRTKKFGNRMFTATVVVEHTLYPDSKLHLKFHYSIGKYGLRARYAESGSDSFGVVTVSEGTPKITDKYAQKNGNDINAVCSYKVSISSILLSPIMITHKGLFSLYGCAVIMKVRHTFLFIHCFAKIDRKDFI